MKPLVTIAIPTFDRLHYLKEAVASALAQNYANVEVVIGDDGRTEAVEEWCRGVAERDARVRYQRNDRRLGLAGNWNALADAARGEFVTIIGDDDRLLPDFVGKLVEAALPDADVAFANHYLIDSRGERLVAESLRCAQTYRRDRLSAGLLDNAAAVVWQNSVPMSASLIRTEHVRRLRFKEDLNTPEIEMFARLAQEGGRFTFTPEYLAEYRTHAQSATAGGLRSEALIKYLDAIPVAPEVEPDKRELMAGLLVNAVSRCLQQGKTDSARQFLKHKYYPWPRWQWVRALRQGQSERRQDARSPVGQQDRARVLRGGLTRWAQDSCALLPAFLGCRLYRLARRAKSAL